MSTRLASACGALALLLAAFVYFFALGSDHAATNGDELLYVQIARVTGDTGHWLPLQTVIPRHRNTKPPALFWQGLASTGWGKSWDLWHLRYPNVLYSLATAAMCFALGRRMGGGRAGLVAALAYLCFFGTYRYGRVFLTSAPETFWLFAPFFLLLVRKRRDFTWSLAAAFGLIIGAGLLYKSFALVGPPAAALACWTLSEREYRVGPWVRSDVPKIALASLLALAVFSLWYWLDPQRHLILQDFVLKENAGKFDAGDGSYLLNMFWGDSSIWRNVVSYPINAGLLAPAVLAVFVIGFLGRKETPREERLLWIWIISVFAVFCLPNQRDERYLLIAMPALAVLCGLYWEQIPRWVLSISLVAVGVIAVGMGLGAMLLTRDLGLGAIYPWYFWAAAAGLLAFALASLFRGWRVAVLPSILFLYLLYGLFLIPFDGPLGEYDASAIAFARGKTVAAPANFGAREEMFRFLLPGCDIRPYWQKPGVTAQQLQEKNEFFIVSIPARDTFDVPGLRVVGTRLNLVDRFRAEETADMLRGNVSPHLFQKDLLVEVVKQP